MAIFLTGSTGYVGAHVAALLLENHQDNLNLLVRAKTGQEAAERLWKSLQIHLDFPSFYNLFFEYESVELIMPNIKENIGMI